MAIDYKKTLGVGVQIFKAFGGETPLDKDIVKYLADQKEIRQKRAEVESQVRGNLYGIQQRGDMTEIADRLKQQSVKVTALAATASMMFDVVLAYANQLLSRWSAANVAVTDALYLRQRAAAFQAKSDFLREAQAFIHALNAAATEGAGIRGQARTMLKEAPAAFGAAAREGMALVQKIGTGAKEAVESAAGMGKYLPFALLAAGGIYLFMLMPRPRRNPRRGRR